MHRVSLVIFMLAMVSACWAQSGGAANPSSFSSSTTDPASSFTGCYELRLGRWWPWGFGEDDSFVTPPNHIELLPERGVSSFEKDELLLRTVPTEKSRSAGHRRSSYWRATGANQILIVWTDGFTGLTLELKRDGGTLTGWAHPHFDAGEIIPRTARATARYIPCPPTDVTNR